ncbi:MAG: hypothetical protein CO189_07610 [candidate division Zixibacteria bacterium CG_4_9_14_3_um_filter_46_8]|nr:MAG: hypothetical protein CO189_07610 [candidate division Zixibacteria bacterium CG_4_9_14_3_um_filter_46_8]
MGFSIWLAIPQSIPDTPLTQLTKPQVATRLGAMWMVLIAPIAIRRTVTLATILTTPTLKVSGGT